MSSVKRIKYIKKNSGDIVRISSLSDKQLGIAISLAYKNLRTLRCQLFCLHDVLYDRRKKENHNAKRTNTDLKIIENLGLKTRAFGKLANDDSFVSKCNAYLEEMDRNREKSKIALKLLEEGNIDKTMELLRQLSR
ncbi:hypothetical protein QKV95_gp048 [Poseidoniales virus YSH_150918]|uniref:Uncharacterized protein n=1 Tax=Poseidoniales virus YSH_150918 TaxID=3071324 RepID=A0A976UAX5_9CAUD|nr:hypothetical protein QKV95_gp048 [Yangshan Harbor Poseidoniales virus]UVF62522.1 hypothetical protein [Poseidoniales virus YSH_150918]